MIGGLGLACLTALLAVAAGTSHVSADAPARLHRGLPDTIAARLPSPNVAAVLSNVAVAIPIIASTQAAKEADTRTRNRRQLALVCGGLVAGPAAGYLYGGCAARGLRGVAWRATATATCLGLLSVSGAYSGDEGGGLYLVALPAAAAAVFVVGSALWDVAGVADAVTARSGTTLAS